MPETDDVNPAPPGAPSPAPGLPTLPPPPPAPPETPVAPDEDEEKPRSATRRAIEWGLLVALALIVALLLRTFVVQSFYIPSTSMLSTLKKEDRVLVNKLAYRFGDPGRGDIVVFEAPPGEDNGAIKDLIKRIVGLPGETIEGRDGHVFIDGEQLDEPYLDEGVYTSDFGPEKVTCPERPGEPLADECYFMMGDNRGDSRDSRAIHPIPRDDFVGKAFVRFWPPGDFGLL